MSTITNYKAYGSFFYENFVQYDPFNQRCVPVSGIEEAEVIFIGEMHYTHVLQELQCEALRRLANNVSCCVLLEGLKPGQVVKKMPQWESLPDTITFLGSDVRSESDSANYVQWTMTYRERASSFVKRKEVYEASLRDLANKINDSITNQKTFDEVVSLPVVSERLDDVDIEIGRLSIRDVFLRYEHRRSNEGLFREVTQASCQFDKVIAIWGAAHFILGESIFKRLDTLKKKYVILFPNAARWQQARMEDRWQQINEIQFVPQATQIGSEKTTLTIPEI
jgi:hypothetical protein